MRCNNIKNSNNESVNLYGDCSKKIQYENVDYKTPKERYIYLNLLDGFKIT
jgi:hypothetical protein